jgi:two-component system, LytTR family, response regulator
MTIKTIIADDEILARQKLRQLLQDEPEISIAGEGASALETIDLVQLTRPDLVFLDIQMPGMDGFDIISALAENQVVPPPRIIFTTAYDQYALKAFEINAIDYLLKPFTRDRLRQAVQRAKEQLHLAAELPDQGRQSSSAKGYTSRIVFKSKGRILFLPISDIRWIAAEENYVRICTEGESHLLRETMARFESRLDPNSFIRVHRSAIVNLQYVREIRRDSQDGESLVLMHDGQKVPVSRGYRARIAQLLAR